MSNSRVAFYVSKTQGGASDQVASTEVPGITSVSEFRYDVRPIISLVDLVWTVLLPN